MALTIEEVEHVAHLARLRLSAEELEKMRTDLSAILDHIDMLKEVDVSDVAPTAQVTDLFNVMREDSVRPSLPRTASRRTRWSEAGATPTKRVWWRTGTSTAQPNQATYCAQTVRGMFSMMS